MNSKRDRRRERARQQFNWFADLDRVIGQAEEVFLPGMVRGEGLDLLARARDTFKQAALHDVL